MSDATDTDSYGSDSELDEDLMPDQDFQKLLKGQVRTDEFTSVCAAAMRAAAAQVCDGGHDVGAGSGCDGGGDLQSSGVVTAAAPVSAKPRTYRKLKSLMTCTRVLIGRLEKHAVLDRKGKIKLEHLHRKLASLEAEMAIRQQLSTAGCKG
jgi:hypothetical protein